MKRDSPQIAEYISFTNSIDCRFSHRPAPVHANDWSYELRKIVHRPAYHNTPRAALLAILLIFLALGAAACDKKDDARTASSHNETVSETGDCGIKVNIKPWVTFKDMAARMAAGQSVPRAELEDYGLMPAVAAWRQSLAPNSPRVGTLANWLESTWRDELGLQGKQKLNFDRITMSKNFLYAYGHRAQIDELLAEFISGDKPCVAGDLIEFWLSPENIPAPLVLNILPAMAEIRIFENEIFIDTGALQASGADQTVRHIVALLYRNLESLPGTTPLKVEGEQAVAECLRVMMNEGVAGWIEQTTQITFDREHHSLHKVHIVPEDFYRKAQQTVELFEESLPDLLADSTVMADRGLGFARGLAGANSFTKMGIAMADVIASRLGEERLRQVRNSVPDFLAAYQTAALLNDTPIPEPGTAGIKLYESVPPLDPKVYEPLHALVTRYFRSD